MIKVTFTDSLGNTKSDVVRNTTSIKEFLEQHGYTNIERKTIIINGMPVIGDMIYNSFVEFDETLVDDAEAALMISSKQDGNC